jgi:hypothetical protein
MIEQVYLAIYKWQDELRDLFIIIVGYFLRDLKWFLLDKLRQTKKRYKPHRSSPKPSSLSKRKTAEKGRRERDLD